MHAKPKTSEASLHIYRHQDHHNHTTYHQHSVTKQNMTATSKLVSAASKLRTVAHVRSSTIPTDLVKSSAALLSSVPTGGKHTLPDLPYDYGALEPKVSAETMTLHHTKHHNTYVTNLNVGMEKLDAAVSAGDASGIIALQGAIKFNGGGHVNHALFWENMCPPDSAQAELKEGALMDLVNDNFGGLSNLRDEMTPAALGVQGSGWAWLGYNKKTGRLEIASCPNQDPLKATTGLVPLVGIDVWEHAYYVDYRNVRPDYVNAFFDIINWDVAQERLAAAK